MVQGQGLPSLGIAKEISKGTLPDGLTFYLVTNTQDKGYADFALVQKETPDVSVCRSSLSSLPHFGESRPYMFLSENGAGYSESGYVSYLDDATLYSFRHVPSVDQTVADSTLLMLFDIASKTRRPQAIVVSGDINAAKVKERMNLLSMMVPRLESSRDDGRYEWRPRDYAMIMLSRNESSDVAVISVVYSAQRLDASLMNTPQPIVSRSFANRLGVVVGDRIRTAFTDAGIPLADVVFRYRDSAHGSGDEYYSFAIYTSASYLEAATKQIAAIFGRIDASGVPLDEFSGAKAVLQTRYQHCAAPVTVSNSQYVDKCVASYLYGSSLASMQMENAFIDGRRLSDERELPLFNSFVKALLDPERNLILRYNLPDINVDRNALLHLFNSSWEAAASASAASISSTEASIYESASVDSLSSFNIKSLVRLRSETVEPVSGGKLWTFSNGIRVVYKKLPTDGDFRFAMLLRGGFASVPGLKSGESAFVPDMLSLSSVAGMSGEEFHRLMEVNGITMDEDADLSCLRISGSAPGKNLPLLMRSLLSISQKRSPDQAAFDRYKRAETLRIDMEKLRPRDMNSLMDSIVRPDYFYTARRSAANLGDDLPRRAEQYFAAEFDKVNDGIFVFVGDLDEDVLKKELCRTLGNFKTQKKVSARPRVSSRMASGAVTYTAQAASGTVGGKEVGANIALSAAVPYNIGTDMSFAIACMALEKELARVLAPFGAYAELSSSVEFFPTERLSLFISCHPCHQDGLPADVSPADPLDLIGIMRKTVSSAASMPISKTELKRYKDALQSRCAADAADAESIIENVIVRYCAGKDRVTGYKNAIGSVTVESVHDVFAAILAGAQVEYVII